MTLNSVTTTVRRATPDDPMFDQVIELFDGYRQHYGMNPAPQAAGRWLRDQHDADRLRIYVAGVGGKPRGILTLCVIPASLTLRTVWSIRDLYVAPDARRGGIARALLAHVADAARAEGAHRLSLQTEVTNHQAQSLYAAAGFEPVTDLTQLILMV